jgi:NADP-dependent 3-hydroxy acid dehydrogenase YdfG
MKNILDGVNIFITGATSGFGEASARMFINHGAKLILTGRRRDRLDRIKNDLASDKVHCIELDIRNKQSVMDAVSQLPSDFANIDVLINNAGLALGLDQAQNCNLEDWENMVDTNIKGVLYCTHAILPKMVAQNSGYIINIGSVAGTYPYPGGNVYGGTKAFLKQFSLNLRADLVGNNIRITNIEPGNAETEFSVVRFKGNESLASSVYANTEAMSANDIAETLFWCLTRPKHVNINSIELMPTCQAFSPFNIKRNS